MANLAPAQAQAMPEVFREIGRVEQKASAVVARLTTGSGVELELHVGPGRACFHEDKQWTDYELVVPSGFDPPGWLRRFATGEDTVFGMVPRTVLTHLVDRLGGIARAVVEPAVATAQVHMMVTVPVGKAEETAALLRRFLDKHVPDAPARVSLIWNGEVVPQ